jgi:hypothetical protein
MLGSIPVVEVPKNGQLLHPRRPLFIQISVRLPGYLVQPELHVAFGNTIQPTFVGEIPHNPLHFASEPAIDVPILLKGWVILEDLKQLFLLHSLNIPITALFITRYITMHTHTSIKLLAGPPFLRVSFTPLLKWDDKCRSFLEISKYKSYY